MTLTGRSQTKFDTWYGFPIYIFLSANNTFHWSICDIKRDILHKRYISNLDLDLWPWTEGHRPNLTLDMDCSYAYSYLLTIHSKALSTLFKKIFNNLWIFDLWPHLTSGWPLYDPVPARVRIWNKSSYNILPSYQLPWFYSKVHKMVKILQFQTPLLCVIV